MLNVSADLYADRQAAIAARSGTVYRTPAGYQVAGRAYVALRCHCRAADCPGYAMVHDEPSARAYFEKLFGAPASWATPRRP